jgi:hypothetical protein
VTVSKKVLQVAAENRKRGSLGVRRKCPVLLDLNSHVTLSAAITVLLEVVNDAAITEVVFVVDVDAILGAKISPASEPSA